jgi:hypothetical protein
VNTQPIMTTDERELRWTLVTRLDRDIVILKNYGWLIDHGHWIDRGCGTIVDPDGGGGYAISCLAEEGFTPATRGA